MTLGFFTSLCVQASLKNPPLLLNGTDSWEGLLDFTRNHCSLVFCLCCSTAFLYPFSLSLCVLPYFLFLSWMCFSLLLIWQGNSHKTAEAFLHFIRTPFSPCMFFPILYYLCFTVVWNMQAGKIFDPWEEINLCLPWWRAVPPLLPRWRQNARYFFQRLSRIIASQIHLVFKLCVQASVGVFVWVCLLAHGP